MLTHDDINRASGIEYDTRMLIMELVRENLALKLPEPPPEPDNWDKYLLISLGQARIKKSIRRINIMKNKVSLTDAFIYKKTPEQREYLQAKRELEEEAKKIRAKLYRIARKLLNEYTLEVISKEEFANGLDKLCRDAWGQ